MKRKLFVLLIGAILLLVGCSNGNADEDSENSQEENSDETQSNEENQEEEIEDVVEEPEVENEIAEEEPESVEVEYQINAANSVVEPLNDSVNEKVALLTIDDAPDGNALEMAKTLAKLDAKAIFFVNGHFLDTDEEKAVLKEIHEMGFPIGNHTYTHANLTDISEEQQREEIVSLNDLVEEIIGERPVFFRAPFGANSDFSRQLAEEEGMVVMNWTYGYDWNKEYMSEAAIADIMVDAPELNNGANLLMHDRDWTAAALEEIVTGLRDKGYEMVDPDAIQKIDTN